jgi:hypothetical protein
MDFDDAFIQAQLDAELANQASIAQKLRKPEPAPLEVIEAKPLPAILGPLDVRSTRT